MEVLRVRDVGEAYSIGIRRILADGQPMPSRAGDVLVMPWPVTTVYEQPTSRVLRDSVRDANPFFHLMESVWMLAGRDDARWLDRYVRDFSRRFAEDDGRMHGAYGHRWLRWLGMSQLEIVGDMLARDPLTRQAVIAMWDPKRDLDQKRGDLPCNTHVYFRARSPGRVGEIPALDMTVCCRSNDIIFGAYGANAVHMSVMQEVVAALAGMQVGTYYQVSNNWHAYVDVLDRMTQSRLYWPGSPSTLLSTQRIAVSSQEARQVLRDATSLCDQLADSSRPTEPVDVAGLRSEWILGTVVPMENLHRAWRRRERDPFVLESLAIAVQSEDWRDAGSEWISRRMRTER